MILLSPAKINIGLRITHRRSDGFHNLQSVMYPVGLCDVIEIREAEPGAQALIFSMSGIPVQEGSGKNLCEKAHEIFSEVRVIPPVEIHLHKQIPVGAGLGGGSSNATQILKGLNRLTANPLTPESLHDMAARLGSDCPFFLHDHAMMIEGRGEILSPSPVTLEGLWLVLLFPEIHISTAEAYSGVTPVRPGRHLDQLVAAPVQQWRETVVNDFESGIFAKYPELASHRETLYKAGAIYASLSGSGSSLYGIFTERPGLPASVSRYVIWEGRT
ncbi:MAG: 4-(cytidine 5'-diphospho)-2-C-methyl-D-erythritol kinase [Bacteroidales bacterium]